MNEKVKHRRIEKNGYLDETKKVCDDPISYFRELVKQKLQEKITELTIKNLDIKIISNSSKAKNLGYSVIKTVYKNLGSEKFLNNKNKSHFLTCFCFINSNKNFRNHIGKQVFNS